MNAADIAWIVQETISCEKRPEGTAPDAFESDGTRAKHTSISITLMETGVCDSMREHMGKRLRELGVDFTLLLPPRPEPNEALHSAEQYA